jgi:hypothetical protein
VMFCLYLDQGMWHLERRDGGVAHSVWNTEEEAKTFAQTRWDELVFSALDTPPIGEGSGEATAYADLLDRLERGVIQSGMADDNSTELYLVDDASETMWEAAQTIKALSARPENKTAEAEAEAVAWMKPLRWESVDSLSMWASIPDLWMTYRIGLLVDRTKVLKLEMLGNRTELLGTFTEWDDAKDMALANLRSRVLTVVYAPTSPSSEIRRKAMEEAAEGIKAHLGEEGDREGYYKGRQDGLIEALSVIRALASTTETRDALTSIGANHEQ